MLTERFNATRSAGGERRRALLAELLGGFSEGSEIRAPMFCDYGMHITSC